MTPFVPAPFIRSAHAQTIFGALRRKPSPPPGLERERWETKDGDFFDVEVLAPRGLEQPTVVLLHGLEGSSSSGYILQMLRLVAARGWAAYALNFRGCSGEPNRLAKSYCSGDTDDLVEVLSRLRGRGHEGPVYAVGFSLGGNVLLKHLGESSAPGVDAAVAVSVPFDLAQCARLIDAGRGLGSVYLRTFIKPLRLKALQKAKAHPGVIDEQKLRAADTIWKFDDAVTSQLYGLKDAAAYYAWASSGPRLKHITVPTLIITAADDSLAPASLLPADVRSNSHLTVVETTHGGHVGFVAGSIFAPQWWSEETAVDWLAARQ